MSHWDGQITLDPNAWLIGPIIQGINYSISMPLHPWSPWTFQFPIVGGEVDYLTTDAPASLDFQWVQIEFTIDNGDGQFWEAETGFPGQIRLILQHAGDNWQSADGRFWSQPLALDDGHYIMTVPLDPNMWTNVFGQVSLGGFANVLASGGNVGFTFGGQFAGHGVFSDDNAQFHLLNYDFLNDPTTNLTPGNDDVNFFVYNDIVYALEGDDRISANQENDIIYGNQGADTLQGNQGNDHIWGGKGDDLIFGGQGDDHLSGNLGNDTINGNLGNDILHLRGSWAEYSFIYGDQMVTITGPEGTDVLFNTIEFVIWDSGEVRPFDALV